MLELELKLYHRFPVQFKDIKRQENEGRMLLQREAVPGRFESKIALVWPPLESTPTFHDTVSYLFHFSEYVILVKTRKP